MEEAKDPFDEEDEDVNYWEQLHEAYRSSHRNVRPPFNPSTDIDDRPLNTNSTSTPIVSQDHRPIRMNPTGQYNLNFVDWNNEWERVYNALGEDGKLLIILRYFHLSSVQI